MNEAVSGNRLVRFVEALGNNPDDSSDVRLQKTIVVASAVMMSIGGIVWGIICVAFSEPWASAVPFGYVVITLLNIIAFRLFDRFRPFRFIQILTSLLLPFFLMVVLGGFIDSGAVVIWSLVAPIGAVLVTDRREATLWFLAFVGVVVVGGLLEPIGRDHNNLPPAVVTVFFVLNVLAPPSLAIVVLQYFLRQKDTAMGLLGVERKKSDDLLLNVLPSDIATELKENGSVVARRFDAVSVLFADIVGSTQLTARLAPEELIELLNRVFTRFDLIADRCGAEKIRTIGDNYMAATGVLHPSGSHATDLADMALDMMASIDEINASGGAKVQFRIGLNAGPVIAGVVGQRKFHYDIWGDAVNTASRMESNGVPGKIQITRGMMELLSDDFVCASRGTVDVKGKGETECWLLEGRKPPRAGRTQPATGRGE